jgi:hypothetical protein
MARFTIIIAIDLPMLFAKEQCAGAAIEKASSTLYVYRLSKNRGKQLRMRFGSSVNGKRKGGD